MIEEELHEEARLFDSSVRAASTRKLYGKHWEKFVIWCDGVRLEPLPAPPETVALYAAWLARRLKPATVSLHLCAIRFYHIEAGYEPPTSSQIVQRRLAGIRRAKPTRPKRKAPLTIDRLDVTVDVLNEKIASLEASQTNGRGLAAAMQRKALLLLGFAAAMRRSELVGLDCRLGTDSTGYIEFTAEGMDVVLLLSKTDQAGEGRRIAIPYRKDAARCPVRAVRSWLVESGINSGPIFRAIIRNEITPQRLRPPAVGRAVKWAVRLFGLPAAEFGGHSLRAGLVTSAAKCGAPITGIQAITGHKKLDTLVSYIRDVNRYTDSALHTLPGW